MRTTLLNPTVWLLVGVAVSAAAGVWRGDTARRAFDRMARLATSWPVLAALLMLTCGGVGSRVVIGYMSPGVYAEEVVSARSFLEERRLYAGSESRARLAAWMAEAPAGDPFTLPGISPCQASAMASRPTYFTSQGHPPTLLLASVPVVSLAGGHGLYIMLTVASLAGILLVAALLARVSGVQWRSRGALVLTLALIAWQPVLAGLRQGDAVVSAAALVVVAWHFARLGRGWAAGAVGLACCLALPALGSLFALARCRPRAGMVALVLVAAAVTAAGVVGGIGIFADFGSAVVFSARTYADSPANYAVAGRLQGAGISTMLSVAVFALVAAIGLARSRTVDSAFAAGLALGLLAVPILWSQHLTLALLPLAELLRGWFDTARRSSWPAGRWSRCPCRCPSGRRADREAAFIGRLPQRSAVRSGGTRYPRRVARCQPGEARPGDTLHSATVPAGS